MGDEIREGFPEEVALACHSEADKQVQWTRVEVEGGQPWEVEVGGGHS